MAWSRFRSGVALVALVVLAAWAAIEAPEPALGDGDRERAGRAGRHTGDDRIVQHAVLRWRDSWPYGATDADSVHERGTLVAGDVTLTRRASGIRLEVRDRQAVKGNAYSIWFQICPEDSVFIEDDTQCSLPKLLNMNGSGGVAGPHGLDVTFTLPSGTVVPPANVCAFDPGYLVTPCAAWSEPGILVGDVEFSEAMALSGQVRIVVKDHGPTKVIKDLGRSLGLKTREALFTATHRTDGPECQPVRPMCPDAHIAVFPAPPAAP